MTHFSTDCLLTYWGDNIKNRGQCPVLDPVFNRVNHVDLFPINLCIETTFQSFNIPAFSSAAGSIQPPVLTVNYRQTKPSLTTAFCCPLSAVSLMITARSKPSNWLKCFLFDSLFLPEDTMFALKSEFHFKK